MIDLKLKFPEDFFQEEVQCGFTVTKERKQIWAVELDLLNELDRVCRKHHLQYYLDGGTLLGAVRHKGYIPWDDDIDVTMFRADFEQLKKIAPLEFHDPYFFQNAYTDPYYCRGHIQLRNSGTCGARRDEANRVGFNQGIFIDIFPLDGLISDPEKLQKQIRDMTRLHGLLSIIYTEKASNPFKAAAKSAVTSYVKSHFTQLFQKYERLSTQYNDSEDVEKMAFHAYVNRIYRLKKEWYDQTVMMPFANLTLPVPAGYKEILTTVYGANYMTPKQVNTNHGDMIMDTSRSYREVLADNPYYRKKP